MHRKTPLRVAVMFALSLSAGLVAAEANVDDGTAPRTTMSTQIFLNASDLQRSGAATDEGTAVELKRFFVNLDHTINEEWSVHVTTDMQWLRNDDPTELWLRHAYLQRRLGSSATLRLGSAATPWIGYVGKRNGFRYVDPDLMSRMGLGNPADWGVHVQGERGQADYAVSVMTGAGYKRPRTGERADVEARFAWAATEQIQFAVGGYNGTRAMDVNDAARLHTAERWNAMASYVDPRFRLGAEYFRSTNWNRVNQLQPDAGRGWAAWTSYRFAPRFSVFARHDRSEMSLRLDPSREDRYSQLGVEWKQSRHLRLALVGKRHTVGSLTSRAEANEAGVWGQLEF